MMPGSNLEKGQNGFNQHRPKQSPSNRGVGIIQKSIQQIIKPKPINKVLQSIVGGYCIGMYGIRVSPTSIVLVYNIYGVTNGDHCPKAREATNSILAAVLDDMTLQPKGPKLIVGDFNASIETLTPLAHAIEQGTMHDVGANASKYGGVDCMRQGGQSFN